MTRRPKRVSAAESIAIPRLGPQGRARLSGDAGEADPLERSTSVAQSGTICIDNTGNGELIAIIVRDDQAPGPAGKTQYQLVAGATHNAPTPAGLLRPEHGLHAETQFPLRVRRDTQEVAAGFMPPLIKPDRRYAGRIGYDAGFDGRPFQPGS